MGNTHENTGVLDSQYTVVEEIEAAVNPDATVKKLWCGVALDLPLQFAHIDKDSD